MLKFYTHCLSCNEGYNLTSSNICVLCIEPCKTCSAENYCSTCIDNYFALSGKCYQCNTINCKTKESDNCKCKVCEDGYYLSNYQCHKCASNCKTCSNTTIYCIVCFDGYYLTSNNTCSECISPCRTCSSETNCLTCLSGYFLFSNECKEDIIYTTSEIENIKISSTIEITNKITAIDNIDNIIQDILTKYKNDKSEEMTKEEEINYYNEIISLVESMITDKIFDTTDLDNGKEQLIKTDKLIITFATTQSQKNK